MLPVPGGGDSVVDGVRETDEGRGPFVPGAAEGKVPVQGVWGGDGSWVAGGAHAGPKLEDSEGDTELGIHTPWQGTADVPDGLPGRRRTAELPV